MKILLIDNGTKHLRRLKNILAKTDFDEIDFTDIDLSKVDKYDAVILSGGHDQPVLGNEALFHKEIELIKAFNKPLLGICLGFELIAYAYGAHLEKLEERDKGIKEIKVLKSEDLFHGVNNFKVYESHKWAVKKLPYELMLLALSTDGVEAFKNIEKPIYGVQFHPEMFEDSTCGEIIINNFLKIA